MSLARFQDIPDLERLTPVENSVYMRDEDNTEWKVQRLGTAAFLDAGAAAGNVPVLDASGKLVASTIPDLAISQYRGDFATEGDLSTTMAGGVTWERGDWVTAANVDGNSIAYIVNEDNPIDFTMLRQITFPVTGVTSFNGRNGAVFLVESDIPDLGSIHSGAGGFSISNLPFGDLLVIDGSTGAVSVFGPLNVNGLDVESAINDRALVVGGSFQGAVTFFDITGTSDNVIIEGDSGNITVGGIVSAANFNGSGAALTGISNTQISGLGTASTRNVGTANGNLVEVVAGKITSSLIPASAITDTFVVASQAAMLALSTAEKGDVAVRTDQNKSYVLAADPYSTLANWQVLLTPTDAVLSWNGLTGAIVATTTNLGEGTNLYFTNARAVSAMPNTTRGDLLFQSPGGLSRLAIGATGTFLRSNGTDPSWQTISAADVPTLTLAKISDAGTAASKSTGTAAGNVPILDGSGKLATLILPALAITDTFVVASQAAMLALSTAEKGDVAVRTDQNKSYILSADPYSTLANWELLRTPTDLVLSVNGQTGAVSISSVKGQWIVQDTGGTANNVILDGDAGSIATVGGITIGDWATFASGADFGDTVSAANGFIADPGVSSNLGYLFCVSPTPPDRATGEFRYDNDGLFDDDTYLNKFGQLELANRNQTNGTVCYFSFSGNTTPGYSTALFGAVTRDHTWHYGDWFVWTRGSSGYGVRLLCDQFGNLILNDKTFASGAYSNVGGGKKCIFIANASVNPSANPTGGGILYVSAGALKYRGSGGTVTTVANA